MTPPRGAAVTRHQAQRALWSAAAFFALALAVTYGAVGHTQIAGWFAAGVAVSLVALVAIWVSAE